MPIRADIASASRAVLEHPLLEGIGQEGIEWHGIAHVRLAPCINAAQTGAVERGTAARPMIVAPLRRD